MNAFLTSSIHGDIPARGNRTSVLSWIKGQLEARQRRQREREEISRLRKLEPYLLADAGIEAGPLYAAMARIVEAHATFTFSR